MELSPRIASPSETHAYITQESLNIHQESGPHSGCSYELPDFISTLTDRDPSASINWWCPLKHNIAFICSYCSSKYEKHLKANMVGLNQQEPNDYINQYETTMLQAQIASANHTGSKLALRNDTLDKSLHQFMMGHKKILTSCRLVLALVRERKIN